MEWNSSEWEYLGNFQTFIIDLKTKYDKFVLRIVCQSPVWSCHNVTADNASKIMKLLQSSGIYNSAI